MSSPRICSGCKAMVSSESRRGTRGEHFCLGVGRAPESNLSFRIIKRLVREMSFRGVVQPLFECRHPTVCQQRVRRLVDELKKQLLRLVLLDECERIVPGTFSHKSMANTPYSLCMISSF